ncbi:MAG: hypothetical protein KDI82_04425 [Gammaproteobacteria bacterium]|nr:hypothetical protein [Gammaproteobacteria bacterium]
MSGWIERLAQAPDGALWLVGLVAVGGAWFGFTGMRRVRQIEDVPTARVRSAPQGYVELIGKARAMSGEPVVAPFSKTPCCWYSYRVERRSRRGSRPVESGSSDAIFLLRDESGECVIDPEGAEVTSRHKSSWSDDGSGWGGHGVHARLPSLGPAADLAVQVGGSVLDALGSGVGEYRYTESVILDGDPIYAIGRFRTLGANAHGGAVAERTGAILREWKRQPDTLRERFDRNRDGQIDQDEWQQARAAATREATREQAHEQRRGPLHLLERPGDGRYFLLSNLEEFGLLRRYRWRMRLGFLAFALALAATVWMLAARP